MLAGTQKSPPSEARTHFIKPGQELTRQVPGHSLSHSVLRQEKGVLGGHVLPSPQAGWRTLSPPCRLPRPPSSKNQPEKPPLCAWGTRPFSEGRVVGSWCLKSQADAIIWRGNQGVLSRWKHMLLFAMVEAVIWSEAQKGNMPSK